MSGCISTCYGKDTYGYGRVHVGRGKYVRHHRKTWQDSHGPIPKGCVIRHKCDNPSCVNIEHLEIGTQLDNIADRDSRGRTAKGLNNGRCKVTPEMIKIITNSQESSRALGRSLNISHTSVLWVRNKKTSLSIGLVSSPNTNTIDSSEDKHDEPPIPTRSKF